MKLRLLNIVVFAEQYDEVVKWYAETFDLEVMHLEKSEFNYSELGIDGHVVVGITPAAEIKHQPTEKRNNSTIMQLEVSDIKSLFEKVRENGGEVLFGPSFEENDKFYYGGIADIEGNQIWVIENSID